MTARIAFLGDTLLGGDAQPVLDEKGYGHALAGIRDLWADADLVVANHEAPLTERTQPAYKPSDGQKRYWYKGDPGSARALAARGIRVVSLANNHVGDFGAAGVLDTMAALDAAGIAHCGAGPDDDAARRPVTVQVGEVKVGFLSVMQRYDTYVAEDVYAREGHPGPALLHLSASGRGSRTPARPGGPERRAGPLGPELPGRSRRFSDGWPRRSVPPERTSSSVTTRTSPSRSTCPAAPRSSTAWETPRSGRSGDSMMTGRHTVWSPWWRWTGGTSSMWSCGSSRSTTPSSGTSRSRPTPRQTAPSCRRCTSRRCSCIGNVTVGSSPVTGLRPSGCHHPFVDPRHRRPCGQERPGLPRDEVGEPVAGEVHPTGGLVQQGVLPLGAVRPAHPPALDVAACGARRPRTPRRARSGTSRRRSSRPGPPPGRPSHAGSSRRTAWRRRPGCSSRAARPVRRRIRRTGARSASTSRSVVVIPPKMRSSSSHHRRPYSRPILPTASGCGLVSASCTGVPRLWRRRASRCGGIAATQKSARSPVDPPVLVAVVHLDTVRAVGEREDLRAVPQPPGTHLRRQGVGDVVHPADRLEHHHRLLVAELEGEVEADLTAQDLVQRRRRPGDDALLASCAGIHAVPPAAAPLVPPAPAPAA